MPDGTMDSQYEARDFNDNITIRHCGGPVFYAGTCKNKTQLRTIMEWVGIKP